MANAQLQKTVTKTAISQKQSLEIVQTLLHGGLSSLAYLREFFHDKAFLQQYYESGKIHTYADYANGRLPKNSWEIPGPKTAMQILRKGSSKRADMFLEWLEGGVFSALKDGTLHSLEVYVHPDSDDRERVIERYTFTVSYATRSESGQNLAQLEMDSDGSPTLSLEATGDALTSLLKQIIKICSTLPELPAKRFVTMRLFYTYETRKPPKLPGWAPGTSDRIFFAKCEGWEKYVEQLESLDSGLCSSSLKIDHLQPIGEDARRNMPGYEPPALPESLRFDQPSLDLLDPVKLKIVPRRDRIRSIIDNLGPSDDDEVAAGGGHDRNRSPGIPHSDNTIYTQASNVPDMVNGLSKMLQREVLTQGDTQTQVQVNGRKSNQPTKDTRPKVVARTVNRLEANKQNTKTEKDDGRISCTCGYEEDEGQMICCLYCNTWQHLHCYGYASDNDPRLPSKHVCYECLLGGREDETLEKLEDLARKRRGMRFALESGLKGQREFATDMDMSQSNGAAVYKHLKEEGYVVGAKGSHKPGYAVSGKPQFVAVTEPATLKKMLANLFDPMMHIGHHFEIPDNFAVSTQVLSQQLLASQKAMPPPITPASQLKNNAAATPSTDLDMRGSTTPFETPIRPRNQAQPTKRARDDDENADVPFKRHVAARLPNNATMFMLDAGGIPSPTPTFIQGSDIPMQNSDPNEMDMD